MQNKVRHIDHIVDRTQANRTQTVLHPFRTLLDCHTLDGHTRIAQASLRVLYLHRNTGSRIIDLESLHRRSLQLSRFASLLQVSSQITSHPIVRSSIHPVRGNIDLQYEVTLYIIIFFGRSSHNRLGRQDDDTGMVCTNTNLILGTNHTIRLHTTDLRTFDGKTVVPIIQFSTVHSHYDLLSGSHIGCSTHNLQRCFTPYIDRCDVQMVRIGVLHTGQHFANHQTLQTTFNCLNFLYSTGFQTD